MHNSIRCSASSSSCFSVLALGPGARENASGVDNSLPGTCWMVGS